MEWKCTCQNNRPGCHTPTSCTSYWTCGLSQETLVGLATACPMETTSKVPFMQDLHHSCSYCPHCYSSTCWFRNSCSQVILGLLTLDFLSCTYTWPACGFPCCSYNDLGKISHSQRDFDDLNLVNGVPLFHLEKVVQLRDLSWASAAQL